MKFFLRYATKAAKPSECCAAGIPTTPERVCQNEIMDEKTLPVVPSSWEEGLGVVEKNNDITYYKLNI